MSEAALLEVERIKTLSVVGLRRELDKHGLEKSGLKKDLVKRLENFLMDNPTSQNDATNAAAQNDTSGHEKVDEINTKSTNGSVSSTSTPEIDESAKKSNNALTQPTQNIAGNATKNISSSNEKVEPPCDNSAEREVPGIDVGAGVIPAESSTESHTAPNDVSLDKATEPNEIPGVETETNPISGETDKISDKELPADDVAKVVDAQGAAKRPEEETVKGNGKDGKDTIEDGLKTKNGDTAGKKGNKLSTATNNKTKASVKKGKVTTTDDAKKTTDRSSKSSYSASSSKTSHSQNSTSKGETLDHKPKEAKEDEKNDISRTTKTDDAKKTTDRSSKSSSSASSSKTSRSQNSTSKGETLDHKPKEAKEDEKNDISRSIWISNLSSVTKALDLQQLFSEHGQVLAAKVVTSAKLPGSQCFGYVTMSTTDEANICITKFDKTVLHEQTIDVEKAETDPTPGPKKSTSNVPGDKYEGNDLHKSGSKHKSSSRSRHDDNTSHGTKSSEINDTTGTVKSSSKSRDSSISKHKPSKDSSKESKDSTKEKLSKEKSKEKSENSSNEMANTGTADAKDRKKESSQKKDGTKKTDKPASSSKDNAAEKDTGAKEKEETDKARKERIEAERNARDELRRKEKEEAEKEKEREERRKYLAKREKEQLWARKERLRAERERQREEERVREQERVLQEKMAKERYLREKREREERAREERECEERAREEQARQERAREEWVHDAERGRYEQERIERESFGRTRQDRHHRDDERNLNVIERQRKQRMEEEERQFLMEKERLENEINLLTQKCQESESNTVMVDRGLGVKRHHGNDDRRDPLPDAKRALHDSSRYYTFVGRNDSAASNIQRTIQNDNPRCTYNRDRSPHRGGSGSMYHGTDVSDRGGLSRADNREPLRDNRVDSSTRRDMRNDDFLQRTETRPDHRRLDGHRDDQPRHGRANIYDDSNLKQRETDYRASYTDNRYNGNSDRASQYQPPVNNTNDRNFNNKNSNIDNNDRSFNINRSFDTNERNFNTNDRNTNNTNDRNTNNTNDRNFNTNASQPTHAKDTGSMLPIIGQPRVLPFTDIFGRPLQIVPNAQALQAGYAAALAQATAQNIHLQNVGRSPAAGIQLNRAGQLEMARMSNPTSNVQGGRRL